MGIYDRDYYQDDELRPLRPWDNRTAVSLLIIANVAVFLANFVFTSRTEAINGFFLLRSTDLFQPLQWYRVVTYGFAHSGIFHILFNMLGLYFLGQSVEAKYGKAEFLRIYLISVVLCGAIWLGIRGGEGNMGVLGASGAVTTISMLFVFSFPQATLMVYGVLPVKAWVIGIVIVVSNLFGTPSQIPTGDGAAAPQIAYDVHLIGAAFAALYFFAGLNFNFMESFASNARQRIKQKRRGLKVHRVAEQASKEEAESDRILDKISREGQDSLTRKERSFMERYSRKVRERRGLGD